MTRRLWIALGVVLAFPAVAAAQVNPNRLATPKGKEFIVGGTFAGPVPLGTTQADLLDGFGNPSLTLARTRNSLASGFGPEAGLAYQIRKAFWLEISGGWTRISLKSDVREDIENAQGDSISSPVSRFSLEAHGVWFLRERGKSTWFLRMGGGWMRETAGGNTLAGDGFLGGAGIGLKRWFRTRGKGPTARRVGMEFEGRAVFRSGGLSLGESSFRIGPAGAARLVFEY